VGYAVVRPDEFKWLTRPHEPGEPARHVAELSECAGFAHVRGNVWRYEPGAQGRRHRHLTQEETFLVLAGTLSMYVGEPPERVEVPAGGLVRVDPGVPLQSANHGDDDLVVYAYGYPPEDEHAELLSSVV
jgi:mannose-6-phosphate isomerase-like protein (cupin superfamily)